MVNIVTSIGRNGLQDFLLQRVSAIILALYSVFLFGYIMLAQDLTYESWHMFCASDGMKIGTLLALISLIIHSWIGILTIITDYIKVVIIRTILQLIVIFSLIIFFFWGFIIIWSL